MVNFHWQQGQVAISHLVIMNYIYACFSLEFCLWYFVFVCIFKVYVFAFNFCKQASLRITMLWVPCLNINIPFTPRSDKHVTSPYSVYNYVIQWKGSEITQTYQVQDIILIEHQILITSLQGNV